MSKCITFITSFIQKANPSQFVSKEQCNRLRDLPKVYKYKVKEEKKHGLFLR